MNKKIWFVALIALITTLGLMATDIYSPAMPAITEALRTSPHWVQLTVTVTLISAGLSQLAYGPLSDHWGRRPILLAGMGIYIIGAGCCVAAPSIGFLLLARFIQGLGIGAIMALNRIIIRDLFAHSNSHLSKALSYVGAFIALAPAIAPVFGGFIQMHWGWRWVFGFLFAYSLILTAVTWFTLPESHQSRNTSPLSLPNIIANYFTIIQNNRFWINACCAGFALTAMIVCATINPFLLENGLGQSPAEYGLWAMVGTIGFFAGMMLNPHLVARWGTEKTLKTGNWVTLSMSLIFIVMGYFHLLTISAIIIPTIGIEFGIALVFPNAFMGAIAPFSAIAGAAGALYGFLQIAITFLTSLIVAMISESSQLPMGVLLFSTTLISLLLYRSLSSALEPQESETAPLIQETDRTL